MNNNQSKPGGWRQYLLQKKRFHTAKVLLISVFVYVAARDIASAFFGAAPGNETLLINALEAATYLYGVRWVAQRGAYAVERWRGVLRPGANDPFYRQPAPGPEMME